MPTRKNLPKKVTSTIRNKRRLVMTITRRDFLKITGTSLGALALPSSPVILNRAATPAADSASMLYDSTMCVGCRACQTACKVRSGLDHEVDPTGLYEAPVDLSSKTYTLIQVYKDDNTEAFVKHQCMHCIEPADRKSTRLNSSHQKI